MPVWNSYASSTTNQNNTNIGFDRRIIFIYTSSNSNNTYTKLYKSLLLPRGGDFSIVLNSDIWHFLCNISKSDLNDKKKILMTQQKYSSNWVKVLSAK